MGSVNWVSETTQALSAVQSTTACLGLASEDEFGWQTKIFRTAIIELEVVYVIAIKTYHFVFLL